MPLRDAPCGGFQLTTLASRMAASALDELRQHLGDRYLIERQLGRGGMGAVYLARDAQLDRLLAIKVLPSEFATQRDLRERFLRETRTAAGFSHPNIVPVFAVEERDDVLAMAMGYVEGESLAERVTRAGPLTIRETVRLLDDVGYALAYAHGRGVVHRDIKPDNIMLERATGRALVMDFGISRGIHSSAVPDAGLTRVGEIVGTPEYMSPEQASGDVVDGRSDLYSLGLVAWYALTGDTAMSGTTTQQVLVKQLTETLPTIRSVRDDVPDILCDAIERSLRKDPAERFATAEAFVEAVDQARHGEPEVPIPVRNLATELSSLGPVLIGGSAVMWGIWYYIVQVLNWHATDAITQMIVVAAIMASRVLHAWQATRRVFTLGFDESDIWRGLQGLMGEREAGRAMLRADAVHMRRRRLVIIFALVAFVLSFVTQSIAADMRTQIGPTEYIVPPIAQLLYYLHSVLLGGSVVAIIRSPSSMPVAERLFRWTWLSPLGHALLRLAGRGFVALPGSRGASSAPTRNGTRPMAHVQKVVKERVTPISVRDAAADDLRALESRVERLERWRATQQNDT